MTNVQRRVTELLKEIDSVCMEQGIGYSLAGRTAAMCILSGGFTCDDYQADIMMTAEDYKRFCKAVSGKENRAVESLENNPLMDGIYARYVDTSTTLMDLKRGFGLKEQGICVRIWPLRSKALKSRYQKALETLVRTNNMVSLRVKKEYCSDKEKLKVSGLSAARAFLRRPGTMKKFFASCLEEDSKSKSYFYYDGKQKIKVPRKSMSKLNRCKFEGIDLNIADGIEKTLKTAYGEDLAKAVSEAEFPSEEWGVYYDLRHPFRQVIKEAEAGGTDFDRLAEEKADYDEFSARVYRKRLSEADKQYKYVWRTINRFRLMDEYKDKAGDIKKRFEADGADAVREDLADYIEMIEAYTKIKMGFSIDKELLKIAYAVMEADGRGDIVKKAKKLLPAEYEQDLADWLSEERSK